MLDIGCGRGEFLALLQARGVRARGIDVNESMVEVCGQQGLDATKADALEYLRAQPPGSLGGLLAAQVVEHLDPAYLTGLLDAAYAALRPGAPIVLETINPACWFAFFESYVRDITHVRPLHPDTLKFLLLASGFSSVEIRYQAPYPEHDKLQRVAPAALGDAAETLNANVDKLNSLLFTYLDYAAVAQRARSGAGFSRPAGRAEGGRHVRGQRRYSRPVEAATAPPDGAVALDVGIHHHPNRAARSRPPAPAELRLGLGRIADQVVDFRRPQERRIRADVLLPVQAGVPEGGLHQVLAPSG